MSGARAASRKLAGGPLGRRLAFAGASVVLLGGGLATAVAANASNANTGIATVTTTTASDSPTIEPQGYIAPSNDGLGVKSGQIKHVWVIVLENKAYDASFTGLNDNNYLSQTLPSQGALLTHYYGTGHSSLDNYLSLFSGQAPITDDQLDCSAYDDMQGHVDTSGSLLTNPDYGQFTSDAGPDAPAGSNGCVYPASVPTLFNQLDAAKVSWKVYAQDLGNPDASGTPHDAGVQYCGAPDSSVGASPVTGNGGSGTAYPNPSSANATDQYVAKHNPLPWFESVLQSGDCNSAHVAPVLGASDALDSDLQSTSSTPALSVILPNNCSDGHDAVCAGNNLSGGFTSGNGQVANAPINYTGGLYATDLFLEKIVPEIEQSPAFKQDGLIDITWDEAYPPFTFNNSFANSTRESPTAAMELTNDSAGETLWGRSANWEPAGPNTPIVTATNGQQLSAGPGDNAGLDRPSAGTITGTDLEACSFTSVVADGGCYTGQAGAVPATRTDTATAGAGTSTIADNSIELTDEGREVVDIDGTAPASNVYVGQVTDTPVTATNPAGGSPRGYVDTGSFQLVDANGNPVDTSTAVTSITLAARSTADDPFYDAYDPTLGGGDSGAILISPFIKPGTVSNTYYNHYSTLRTLEDILGVASASPGIDGDGHIGYAAQPGLAPFGTDVFTASGVGTTTQTVTGPTTTVVQCVVPRLKGDTLATARLLLSVAQCKLGSVTEPGNHRGKTLVVARASAPAGAHLTVGTKVNLVLRAKPARHAHAKKGVHGTKGGKR